MYNQTTFYFILGTIALFAALALWIIVSVDDRYPLLTLIPRFSSGYTAVVIVSFVFIGLSVAYLKLGLDAAFPEVGTTFEYLALALFYAFAFNLAYAFGRHYAKTENDEH